MLPPPLRPSNVDAFDRRVVRCRLYAAVLGGSEESEGRFVAAGGGDGANEVKVSTAPDVRSRVFGSLFIFDDSLGFVRLPPLITLGI